MEWLAANVFPEEARYADLAYARRAYRDFTQALTRSRHHPRACVFATVHRPCHGAFDGVFWRRAVWWLLWAR